MIINYKIYLNIFIAIIISLLSSSCNGSYEPINKSLWVSNQKDPTLSGDGKKIALIIDRNGNSNVQLRQLSNDSILPLRHLVKYRRHSSPSLSWSGRYLALIAERNRRTFIVIEDSMRGKYYELNLPGYRIPDRISLSQSANQLAIQFNINGRSRIQMFDLSMTLEPDLRNSIFNKIQ